MRLQATGHKRSPRCRAVLPRLATAAVWASGPLGLFVPEPSQRPDARAVAVQSGEVDFALGSDTAGSVRVPASHCGLFGIRTTWGRIPLTGARPLAQVRVTKGV